MGKYEKIIDWIFFKNYREGQFRVPFNREELVQASESFGYERIKNLGDIPYTFRFRGELPKSIQNTAPQGEVWITVGALMGCNVRVGMEDNLFIRRGKLAESNAEYVEKAKRIFDELGLGVGTPEEARRRFGLKGMNKVRF